MTAASHASPASSFGPTLLQILEQDSRVLLLDSDLGDASGGYVVAEKLGERFLQAGLAEQSLFGLAAGLADAGFLPWICCRASRFAGKYLDGVRSALSQRNRTLKIAAFHGGPLSPGTNPEDLSDLAAARGIPGMHILVPADPEESRQALLAAAQFDHPCYVRLSLAAGPSLFEEDYRFEPGKGVTLRQGQDVALVSTGPQTGRVLQAAYILETVGISGWVIHLPTLQPLDEPLLLEAARATGAVVTTEQHHHHGGLGEAVAGLLAMRCPVPVRILGHSGWDPSGAATPPFPDMPSPVAARVAAAATELVRQRRLQASGPV